MKAKEIFAVAVRIIGLAFLYQALAAVPTALTTFCPIFPPPPLRYLNYRSLLPSFFFIAWNLAVAWWMIRGAPRLMRLAFPDNDATLPPSPPNQP